MYHSAQYEEGFSESLTRAVAALSEAVADDDKIVSLLQRHWDLDRGEAEELLAYERTEGFLHREFTRFLEMRKGYDHDHALGYVSSRMTLEAVRSIDRPWSMSCQKLYENIEKYREAHKVVKGAVRTRRT